MENPIQMDDLRVPLFSETSIYHARIVKVNIHNKQHIHGNLTILALKIVCH